MCFCFVNLNFKFVDGRLRNKFLGVSSPNYVVLGDMCELNLCCINLIFSANVFLIFTLIFGTLKNSDSRFSFLVIYSTVYSKFIPTI